MSKEKLNSEIETRALGNIEARAKGEKGEMRIGGLAARFDSFTSMGWYIEVIKRGFFDEINTAQTAALKNHDSNIVLGRTSNDTLKLTVTNEGLEYDVILPDTQAAKDTYEEIQRGDIHQSSFQFTVKESVWREVERSQFAGIISESDLDRMVYNGKVDVRELVKGGVLYDVSPVTFPAYTDTSAAKRSRDSQLTREEKSQKRNTSAMDAKIKAAEAAANSFKFQSF